MKKNVAKSILNNIINGSDKVRCYTDDDAKVIEATRYSVTIELHTLINTNKKMVIVFTSPDGYDNNSMLYFGYSSNIYELVDEMVTTVIDKYDSYDKGDVQTIMEWLFDDEWRWRC